VNRDARQPPGRGGWAAGNGDGGAHGCTVYTASRRDSSASPRTPLRRRPAAGTA